MLSRILNRPACSTLLAVTAAFCLLAPVSAANAQPQDDDHGRDRREVRREDKDVQKIVKAQEKLAKDRQNLRRQNLRREDRDHDTADWNKRPDAWNHNNDRRDDSYRNDRWQHDNDRDDRRPQYRDDRDRYSGYNDRDVRVHDVPVYQDNRQDTKNQWRNIGAAAVAASVYGLLKHDPTIAFAGALGALYSAERYEQDRKSQREEDRARSGLFERGWFERDGVRYSRHETTRDGHKYYYFAR